MVTPFKPLAAILLLHPTKYRSQLVARAAQHAGTRRWLHMPRINFVIYYIGKYRNLEIEPQQSCYFMLQD